MLASAFPAGDRQVAQLRFTARTDGDLSPAVPTGPLTERRAAVTTAGVTWWWVDQVHGAGVVVVDDATGPPGSAGDGLVTARDGSALAIHTADCAPVLLVGDGVVGAAHAGWRGLYAGVIEATVDAMRRGRRGDVLAVIGPCIEPAAYEFAEAELTAVADRYGPGVRGVTATGQPALDLVAGVTAALSGVGVTMVHHCGGCTSDTRWFSHRTRAERGRQASVIWLEPAS